MQNFHIYEAIGRGKHSVREGGARALAGESGERLNILKTGPGQVVYKGRKKKTIEYFAIKSVDKQQRARVLQEVR